MSLTTPRHAEIAPLKPLRYDLSRVPIADVIAPPYDVISPDERAALCARHPNNVVRLELPEGDGDAKYENAASIFRRWRNDGVLVRDEEPAFYRYDQTFAPPGGAGDAKKRTRRGFLGLVKLVSFSARIVLPHEKTLSGPKEDRLKLFRATRASLSPGFMLYRDPARALDAPLATGTTIAEWTTPDGIAHALAKVTDAAAIKAIAGGVAGSTLLVADGHHRYETALRYSEEVTNAGFSDAENLYFMAFFANGDDPELVVFPTHRHVHDLPRFDFNALTTDARALAIFDVTPLPGGATAEALGAALAESGRQRPSLVACAGDGRAALFALKASADLAAHPILGSRVAPLRRTDVALLHMGILEPALGITPEMQAAKTNLWYPQDAAAALRELRSGKGQCLFLMNGTPVADVRAVAEAGEVMPQKSTFFYPKIPTGLAIHTLEPTRTV